MTAEAWEEAFLKQSHDAAVGRLFRGIVHNLNGALQVFSLQTELFGMTLIQADTLLHQLQTMDLAPAAQAIVRQLQEDMQRRSEAVRQMQVKVRASEGVIRRTLMLPDFMHIGDGEPYTLNTVVSNEVEFLCADSFFKHKVRRELALAADLPPLAAGRHLALHQIVFYLLENALEAVRGQEQPVIGMQTFTSDDGLSLVVRDNAPGAAGPARERISAPFIAPWQGHRSPGLYLAGKLAAEFQGSLVCESDASGTSFRLSLPAVTDP